MLNFASAALDLQVDFFNTAFGTLGELSLVNLDAVKNWQVLVVIDANGNWLQQMAECQKLQKSWCMTEQGFNKHVRGQMHGCMHACDGMHCLIPSTDASAHASVQMHESLQQWHVLATE